MALKRHSSLYSFTIPAGAGKILPQQIGGQYFTYVEGSGPILVRLDEQSASLLNPGQGLFAGEGQDFERFELSNPTGLAITVQIWVGYTDLIDRRRNLIEAATEFVPAPDSGGYAAGILAANSFIDLAGNTTLARIRRKAVVVANMDPAVALYFTDAAGVVGLVVRGGETITLPISGFIRVSNSTGAPVSCRIAEIWWNP